MVDTSLSHPDLLCGLLALLSTVKESSHFYKIYPLLGASFLCQVLCLVRLPDKILYVSCDILKNYSLFTWNSHLTAHPVFLFAKYSNLVLSTIRSMFKYSPNLWGDIILILYIRKFKNVKWFTQSTIVGT